MPDTKDEAKQMLVALINSNIEATMANRELKVAIDNLTKAIVDYMQHPKQGGSPVDIVSETLKFLNKRNR